jgi:hypothetical protein
MFLAAKPIWIICKDHFTIFSFFGAITKLLLPIKGGIGELSNKAVTDFEIAKNSSGFSCF